MPSTRKYIVLFVVHYVRGARLRWRDTRVWRHGLKSAFITGCCTGSAIFFASPEAFRSWRVVLKTMVIAGIAGAINYLKQSPLAPLSPPDAPK